MFAQSSRGGRTLTWEGLGLAYETGFAGAFGTTLPNQSYSVAVSGVTQFWQYLVPENVTRGGAVTLERLVGATHWWLNLQILAHGINHQPFVNVDNFPGLPGYVLWEGIQLVPVVDGNVNTTLDNNPILLLANTANQESSRIIWQRMRWGIGESNDASPEQTPEKSVRFQNVNADAQIDIRVKRRFQRDQWAMIYTVETPAVIIPEFDINPFGHRYFRGLFRAPDGM